MPLGKRDSALTEQNSSSARKVDGLSFDDSLTRASRKATTQYSDTDSDKKTIALIALAVVLLLVLSSVALARWITRVELYTAAATANPDPVTSLFIWDLGSTRTEYHPDNNIDDPEFFPIYSERDGPNKPEWTSRAVGFYSSLRVSNFEQYKTDPRTVAQPLLYRIAVSEVFKYGESDQYETDLLNVANTTAYLNGNALSSTAIERINGGNKNSKDYEFVIKFAEGRKPLTARYFCFTVKTIYPYVDEQKLYFFSFDGELIKFGRFPDVRYALGGSIVEDGTFEDKIMTLRTTAEPTFGIFQIPEFKVKYEWRGGLRLDTANTLVRKTPRDSNAVNTDDRFIDDTYNPDAYAAGNDSTNIAAAGNQDAIANNTSASNTATSDYALGKNFWYEQIVMNSDTLHKFYQQRPLATQTTPTPPVRATVYTRVQLEDGTTEYRYYREFPLLNPTLSVGTLDLLKNVFVDWTKD